MNRKAVVSIAGIVVVGIGLFTLPALLGKGKKEVAVELVVDPADGVCKAIEPQDAAGGAWKNKVSWLVRNYNCPQPQYVTFYYYQLRMGTTGLGAPDADVVVSPTPAYSGRLARGDKEKVTVEVQQFNVQPREYKHRICVGPAAQPTTNCLDPDFEVWPF